MAFRKAKICVHLVLILGACLNGCAPLPSKTIQTIIPEESLSFLEIGETTKDQVRAFFGEPWESDEADNDWLYKLRIVATGRWGMCGEYDCAPIKAGKAVLYVLRIDFNEADVVTGWEEFKLD